jgi:hypothetical protein
MMFPKNHLWMIQGLETPHDLVRAEYSEIVEVAYCPAPHLVDLYELLGMKPLH